MPEWRYRSKNVLVHVKQMAVVGPGYVRGYEVVVTDEVTGFRSPRMGVGLDRAGYDDTIEQGIRAGWTIIGGPNSLDELYEGEARGAAVKYVGYLVGRGDIPEERITLRDGEPALMRLSDEGSPLNALGAAPVTHKTYARLAITVTKSSKIAIIASQEGDCNRARRALHAAEVAVRRLRSANLTPREEGWLDVAEMRLNVAQMAVRQRCRPKDTLGALGSEKSKAKRKKARRKKYVADSHAAYNEERPFMEKLSRDEPEVYLMRTLAMGRYREQALAQGVPDRWVLANMRRIMHGREPLPWRGGTVTRGR